MESDGTLARQAKVKYNVRRSTSETARAPSLLKPLPTETTKMAPKELNFITGNKNKLLEVQAILEGIVELKSQSLDLLEIQGTVEEVTIDKCKRAADLVRNR
jgi:hypothetical protein